MQKRQEIESAFISKTKESLDAKMEETQEKREAIMNNLKTKLKDHVSLSLFIVEPIFVNYCLYTVGACWKGSAY